MNLERRLEIFYCGGMISMNDFDFEDLERHYNNLWQEGKIEMALEKVKNAAEKYPKEEYTINLDLAALYLELEEYDKADKILQKSFDKGYWYPEVYIKQIFEKERFSKLVEQWKNLKHKAEKEVELDYIVEEPVDYEESKDYPLFIALHSWGANTKLLRNYWYSNKLQKRYIVVYPRSTQIVGMKNYCWDDLQKSIEDINTVYQEISQKYDIDDSQIIVGGFSQGAGLALKMIFNQTKIPIKGFVSLCPPVMEPYSEEEIKRGVRENVRGVIIAGEKDPSYPRQEEEVERLEEYGLPVSFEVIKDLDHWFPEELSDYIDDALDFINDSNGYK